jgi:dihydroxyacetone kinase-like predicted kinase
LILQEAAKQCQTKMQHLIQSLKRTHVVDAGGA